MFPLLAFFLSSLSYLPSCFPFSHSLPPSLQIMLIVMHQHHEDRTQLLGCPHALNLLWYPSFITCLYSDKNRKSDIWQQHSIVYLVFFCLVVCLIPVWVIFVSVVWMYGSLTEVNYFEYKFAKLLKICLLKIVQTSDWNFIKKNGNFYEKLCWYITVPQK